jgi:hypothetical protein
MNIHQPFFRNLFKIHEMKIIVAASIETLVNTWRHISDASKLRTQRRDNLKSDFVKWFPVFRLPQTYYWETEQEYLNPGLLWFLEGFIELVDVEDGPGGGGGWTQGSGIYQKCK